MDGWIKEVSQAMAFAVLGAVIGVGQLLLGQESLSRRIIIGRALSTGGLAMGAGAVLLWYPELPFLAILGVASLLASLGTSTLERLVLRFIGKEPTS